jgi:CheY-like chemotaxis protein
MRVQTAKGKEAALSREESARRQAEEANRLKDEFLATMSHELRTPLSAILGWVQLLRERTFDQRTLERGIETIERNARVQSKIVEDMLDVSRIITGKLLLRARIVEVNAVVMEAIDVVRPTADAKGVRIVVDLDPSVGAMRADPERLQQIVWNLLVNAIRFTPKGGKIDAIVTRRSEWVSIEIRDTGRGISSDFLPYIWERFRQADSTTTRRSGGLGLGLAIVRHLTEAHGGFAHAESEGEGRGATFRVTLPLASLEVDSGEFETTRPDWPVPAVPGRELQGLNVLIAEDDADTRELLVMMLRDRGAVVTSTSSAEEALARLPEQKYDVIVSDVGMPNLDGYDLIRRIRSMPPEQGGTIPAIALTAYASSEDRKKALLAGFQIHVPKPVSVRDLVAVVVNATSRGK